MNVEEKFAEDLAPLNGLGEKELSSLVQMVLSFLINPSKSDFQVDLQAFAEKSSLPGGALKSVAHGLIVFLQGAMKSGFSAPTLQEKCVAMGLSEQVSGAMGAAWVQNSTNISSSLLLRTITAHGKIVDFDWSFGVTASSDDCNHVGKTFLQLKLTVERHQKAGEGADGAEKGKGIIRERVFMELSLEQFYSFLASMERCRSYLDFVDPA